jgi:serine O-acetyltransferase
MSEGSRDSAGPIEISASTPDWAREHYRRFSWNPSRALLRSLRDYRNAQGPLSGVKRRYAVLRHRFWSAVTGADIPLNAQIQGGLMIPHPNGIVIHPDAHVCCNWRK